VEKGHRTNFSGVRTERVHWAKGMWSFKEWGRTHIKWTSSKKKYIYI